MQRNADRMSGQPLPVEVEVMSRAVRAVATASLVFACQAVQPVAAQPQPGHSVCFVGVPLMILGCRETSPPRKASDVFFTGGTTAERIRSNSKNPAYIIANDVELAGWLIYMGEGQDNPSWNAPEDMHYELMVDPDFIAARYGTPGSSLANVTLPGHRMTVALIPREIPFIGQTEDPSLDPAKRIPLSDIDPDGTSRGIDVNSFLLPVLPVSEGLFHAELNAWWVRDFEDGVTDAGKTIRVSGRGNAPAAWFQDSGDANLFWPFNPRAPDGLGDLTVQPPLAPPPYVMVKGTLWQDGGHVPGWPCGNIGGFFCTSAEQAACWNKGDIPPDPPVWPKERPVSTHGGWIEIHPVDSITRALPQPDVAPKTTRMVSICAPVEILDASRTVDVPIKPIFARPSNAVLKFKELIDGRFTDMRTVDEHSVTVQDDTLTVHVKIHSSGTASFQAKEGRFKASYITWWEPALQ